MRARGRFLILAVVAACGGDDGGEMSGPRLEMPALISVPYVAAGAGASSLDVTVANPGDAELAGITWTLGGDPAFTVDGAPVALAAGGRATLTVTWSGADAPQLAGATLTATSALGAQVAEVWAVAGDPALAAADFAPVTGAGGVIIGDSAVVHLATAPYPTPGGAWTDDRVHVFVPAGYRERDAHDVVLHFHGHNTTLDSTVPSHRYREQVYASGADVILVVPQGPVNAASGDFGKLADPDGTAALLDEVITVLYRAGRIGRPVLGDVTLTSHSGGYIAVAQNLAPAPFAVTQIGLFDSVYGYLSTYRDFALGGGRLRSDYTATGGTDDNNRALITALETAGATVATTPTQRHLHEDAAVIYPTAATHEGSTGDDAAYAEWLRWGARASRRGPRVELRTATAAGGSTTVTWLAPRDADVTGYTLEVSPDRHTWITAAEVGSDADRASAALPAATFVRVVPIVPGVPPSERQASDVYAVAPAADVLVVDGFDRNTDGSWGGLSHDFAARVGAAAGAVHTVANEAVTEDGFDLSAYRAVIWLLGDESSADHTFTAAERAAVDAYLAGGGHLVISGSEVGYELGAIAAGRTWLASTAGAAFAADSADSHTATGAGPLAAVASFGFGGATAPYAEEFADTFTATTGATVVLRYGSGGAAAVGIAGRAVLVGFPLETVDDAAALETLVPALLDFVGTVSTLTTLEQSCQS